MPHQNLRILLVDDDPRKGHGLLFSNLIKDRIQTHGVSHAGYYSLNHDDGPRWCIEHGITWIEDLSAHHGKIDGIIVPAASSPETHPKLLELAFPFNVPIYVDKPFASSRAEGVELFANSKAASVPVMSASALRFSTELKQLMSKYPDPDYVEVRSGWKQKFDEFFIHPAELLCSLIKKPISAVQKVCISDSLDRYEIISGGRTVGAILLYQKDQGFSITVSHPDGWTDTTIESAFFIPTIEEIFKFIRSKTPATTSEHTLNVLHTIDLCRLTSNQKK